MLAIQPTPFTSGKMVNTDPPAGGVGTTSGSKIGSDAGLAVGVSVREGIRVDPEVGVSVGVEVMIVVAVDTSNALVGFVGRRRTNIE